MATITGRMQGLSLAQPEGQMTRPGFGTQGRKFPVRVNTFRVVPPQLTCYHYDVRIEPSDTKRPQRMNRMIWADLAGRLNAFGTVAVAYDGRAMAYSPVKLPSDQGEFLVDLGAAEGDVGRRHNVFTVVITLIRPIDLSLLVSFVNGNRVNPADLFSAIQALNVVVQHGPMMSHINRGASFFLPPNAAEANVSILSKGLQMYRGFYTSLRPGPNGRVFVNLDITSQPMIRPGNLPDALIAYARGKSPRFGPGDLAAERLPAAVAIELGRFVRNVQIVLKIAGPDGRFQKRKIRELLRQSAANSKFSMENGAKTNVAAYFKSHYNVTLVHPEWPCVKISAIALWPIELCDIKEGQKYIGRLDPTQTAENLKFTTVAPRDRIPLLQSGIAAIRPTNAASGLTQWKITIEATLMEVTARALPPPVIMYKKAITPRDGVWDLRGQKFAIPKRIDRMLVFVFDNPQYFTLQDAQRSMEGFIAGCQATGITISNPRPAIHHVPRGVLPPKIKDYVREMARAANLGGFPQLIVCFLARKPCEEYAAIKRFGDVELGVATQCMLIQKAKRGNAQYYGNLALKVNVKLSGTNSILSPASLGTIVSQSTMVFGADVTHPAPGSLSPSIAAVVGTMDNALTLYGTSIRLQPSRVEVIARLDDMCGELLRQWIKKFKTRPQRIIFFRDGVSEGQFPQVLASEVNAIRVACQKIDREYKPKITYIVCGKRHHISFFPKNPQDADPKNGNVKAGTVVDTDITSLFNFDFYCQSHASLLGTGRSAHYTVLVDDSGFSADVLQSFVYNLCYSYARCSRSVSYATPAYYADRCCQRASLLLSQGDDDTSTVHSGASEERFRQARFADFAGRFKAIHANHAEALYFM